MKSDTPQLLNDSDLKKLTSQPLFFPAATDISSLQALYQNMAGLLSLFLGEDSQLTAFARLWAKHVQENYSSYVDQAVSDNSFIRQLLYAFGLRVQLFLQRCTEANRRDNVDSSILESSGVLGDILLQQFNVTPPAAYQQQPAIPSRSNPTEARRAAAPTNAKRSRESPTHDHDQGLPVTNHNRNPAWDIIRHNIPFRHFNARAMPGPPDICRRWHLKGACVTDCPRKASHKPLVDPAQKAFSQWFNSCK